MNQSDMMKQLAGMEQLTNITSVSNALNRDSMRKISEAMTANDVMTSTWGKEYETPTGVRKTKSGKEISYPDEFKIEIIISIRDKLDDFLDGSNILLRVMNPQTIREMVREMRNEIRTIKREENISELDIVNYLEKELANETNRRADARARIDKYDADNEVPF